MLRSGALARSDTVKRLHKAAANCEIPCCASCQFGKAKRKPSPGKQSTVDTEKDGGLKKDNLLAGQRVSVDHFICSTKGRLYTSYGHSSPEKMYTGGCLFVDHATGHVHVEHQISMHTHETLKSKHKYESLVRDLGVVVQEYLSDNGSSFNSAEFKAELKTYRQINKFAGVGAHHGNGVAERAIQTIMCMARTMMLHSAIRWPDAADATHWPMAVDYAVYIYNHLPRKDLGLSPMDLYSGSKWPIDKVHDLHVWGCPLYVLDPAMQDGKKLPRWKPRSRRGVFLGLSPKHSSNVPLVLKIATGHISPQYHCVFDDWFSTVATDVDKLPDLEVKPWSDLFKGSRFQYPFDDGEEPTLDNEFKDTEDTKQECHNDEIRRAQDQAHS